MIRIEKLETYIFNSLFHYIIKVPNGSHIAPHNDEFFKSMDNYCGYHNFSPYITEIVSENQFTMKGEFLVNDYKGDIYNDNYRVVTDSGDYLSELSFDENHVSITTTINVSREVKGTELDTPNIRDNFFTCLSGNGSSGTIIYTEHFIPIANRTRLLHYSDEYDNFEIFELPDNWQISDGISYDSTYKVKVFDE